MKFAKNCLRHEKLKSIFPVKLISHTMKKRCTDKFKVNKASTNRYKFSAIPYMQRLLNEKEKELQQVIGS